MFEREHDLKLDKVKPIWRLLTSFYQGKIVFSADKFSAEVVNQITGESSKLILQTGNTTVSRYIKIITL